MRFKKIMMLTIIFVSLLVISAVSATENVTNDDVVSVSSMDINNTLASSDNDVLVSQENQNSVGATDDNKLISSTGTFTDLANEIMNANGELNLNRDYVYSSNDSKYKTGIELTKKIIINGNGFTINGNNQSRAFYISFFNIVLKNILITNCASTSEGGAICSFYYGTVLNNCTFINCSSKANGGVIKCSGDESIVNCNFINCSASNGGAILGMWNKGILRNCNFINCSASNGGAIYGASDRSIFNNCSFMDCKASGDGGAICGSFVLANSTFVNCSASNGGAIYNKNNYFRASLCSFIGCNAKFDGGAIYSIASSNINSCIFTECSANESGGAVYNTGDYTNITSCEFSKCSANESGGAVLNSGDYTNITSCEFSKCNAAISGAIFNSGRNCNIHSSFFKYCSAVKTIGGAIYSYGANLKVNSCNFSQCSANTDGGAICNGYINFNLVSCIFADCYANESGGAIYDSHNTKYIIDSHDFINSCDYINCFAKFGGAIYNFCDDFNVNSCNFTECNAKYDGGAIYNNGDNNKVLSSNFINCYTDNEKTTSNGAIYNRGANFIVEKCTYKDIIETSIAAENIKTVYNGDNYIVIILKDAYGNRLDGVKVTVTFSNGVTVTPTVVSGKVKVSTNGLKPVKKYYATIIFKGNDKYKKSTTTVSVKVYKATPKIIAKAQTFKRSDKKKLYTIRLLTNQNIKMKYTKVYIKVNGKLYAAQTNKKGYATFKLTKLTNKGKYNAKIMYGGNSYYNSLTTKVKLTVK